MHTKFTEYFKEGENRNGRTIKSTVTKSKLESEYTCDLDNQINYDKLFRDDARKGDYYTYQIAINQDTLGLFDQSDGTFENIIKRGHKNSKCNYEYTVNNPSFHP